MHTHTSTCLVFFCSSFPLPPNFCQKSNKILDSCRQVNEKTGKSFAQIKTGNGRPVGGTRPVISTNHASQGFGRSLGKFKIKITLCSILCKCVCVEVCVGGLAGDRTELIQNNWQKESGFRWRTLFGCVRKWMFSHLSTRTHKLFFGLDTWS